MADDDQDSKTEEPTGKRLQDAHDKGNVVTSQEVKTWTMLAGGTIVALYMTPWMASRLRVTMLPFIEQPHAIRMDAGQLQETMLALTLEVALVLALPLTLLTVIAVAVPIMQHGWLWTAEKIKPELKKINPWSGLTRLFSLRQLLEMVKGVLKLVIVGAAAAFVLWPHHRDVESIMTMEIAGQIAYLLDRLQEMLFVVLAIVLVLAVADYAYQRWDYMKKLRMTKQEVKDEHKQQEGDPMVKGRIRQLRVQRSRERMMQAVPTADVVITNPTHYAVALKYDMDSMPAPMVVAKGIDHLALRIRQLAEENGVSVVENPPLARTLYAAVDIDQEIRPEHYKAVAEVIGYVMRLKGKLRR